MKSDQELYGFVQSALVNPGVLRRFSHQYGCDPEDLQQQVYVAILTNFKRVNAAESLPAYLVAVARNEAISLSRRENRLTRLRQLQRECMEKSPYGCGSTTIVAELGRAEQQEAVREAVAELPRLARQVIGECLLGGMALGDFARKHRIPAENAKSRVRRAKDRLRRNPKLRQLIFLGN